MILIRGFGGRMTSKQKWLFCLLFVLVVYLTNGFRYTFWTDNQLIKYTLHFTLFFCFIIYLRKKCFFKHQAHFEKIVVILCFLPFISSLNSYYYFDQQIYLGWLKTSLHFIWFVYFLLHLLRVKEGTILRLFLFVSIIIVAIQVIQQYSYPNVYFGLWKDNHMLMGQGRSDIAEMRNGLWRFRVDFNSYFSAPIIFVLLGWLRDKLKVFYLFLFALLLTSVYLSLTRQVIFSLCITLVMSFFIDNNKIKTIHYVIGIILIIGLYTCYDILFSSLAEQTNNELGKDNGRLLASIYFLKESTRSFFSFLFGYGDWLTTGRYGEYMDKVNFLYGFYVTDVGFIGKLWQYGFIYIIVCFYLLYCVIFRYKRVLPTYLRLFSIFAIIMSPMIFPFAVPIHYFVWTMLLYVCDLHINKSNLRLKSTSIKTSSNNRIYYVIKKNCYNNFKLQ